MLLYITLFFLRFWIKCQTFLLDLGSMPVVGSSKKIILGSPNPAIAMLSLLFIPPEKVLTFASATSYKSTYVSFSIY